MQLRGLARRGHGEAIHCRAERWTGTLTGQQGENARAAMFKVQQADRRQCSPDQSLADPSEIATVLARRSAWSTHRSRCRSMLDGDRSVPAEVQFMGGGGSDMQVQSKPFAPDAALGGKALTRKG